MTITVKGTCEMSQSSMEKLAALQEQMRAKLGGNRNDGEVSEEYAFYYNFFRIDFGESVSMRFIKNNDPDAAFGYTEKMMYDWTFADPENPGQQVRVKIPCRNMYEPKTDPVYKTISALFENPSTEDVARQFWVKRNYLYNGFVRQSPLQEATPPENPIRVFNLSKGLHNVILSAIQQTNPDLQLAGNPFDYEEGLNFIAKKGKNAKGYADWKSESSFSSRLTPLTEDELAAIEKYGEFDCSTLLPAMPSDEAYKILPDVLDAGLSGEPWNKEWNEYFRAFNVKSDDTSAVAKNEAPMAKALTEKSVEAEEENDPNDIVEDAAPKSAAASDLLNRLKNRKTTADT